MSDKLKGTIWIRKNGSVWASAGGTYLGYFSIRTYEQPVDAAREALDKFIATRPRKKSGPGGSIGTNTRIPYVTLGTYYDKPSNSRKAKLYIRKTGVINKQIFLGRVDAEDYVKRTKVALKKAKEIVKNLGLT